jgi:methyl-accepting chemotaxis protein
MVTTQTASSAEELAANAQSLTDLADDLRQTISYFHEGR